MTKTSPEGGSHSTPPPNLFRGTQPSKKPMALPKLILLNRKLKIQSNPHLSGHISPGCDPPRMLPAAQVCGPLFTLSPAEQS